MGLPWRSADARVGRVRDDGELYPSADLATLRLPSDLLPTVLAALPGGADLAVFCGTVPLRTGGFAYAVDWDVALRMGGATIRSEYSISFSRQEARA